MQAHLEDGRDWKMWMVGKQFQEGEREGGVRSVA